MSLISPDPKENMWVKNLSTLDHIGFTGLHYITALLKVDRVREILKDKTVDLNMIDETAEEATSLYWAVFEGRDEMAELLLELGADPNVANADGHTPLFIAYARNNIKMISLLMHSGADSTMRNRYDETPSDFAPAKENTADVEEEKKCQENK